MIKVQLVLLRGSGQFPGVPEGAVGGPMLDEGELRGVLVWREAKTQQPQFAGLTAEVYEWLVADGVLPQTTGTPPAPPASSR